MLHLPVCQGLVRSWVPVRLDPTYAGPVSSCFVRSYPLGRTLSVWTLSVWSVHCRN